MDELLDNVIGGTVSTLTPLGCLRNCAGLIVLGFLVYVGMVVVFIFIQG